MQPAALRVEARPGAREGQHVLRVTGPVTIGTLLLFREAVRSVAVPSMIIDLTEVPYIDSGAVGALVQAYASCQKVGRRMALVGLSHRSDSYLEIKGESKRTVRGNEVEMEESVGDYKEVGGLTRTRHSTSLIGLRYL